MGEIDQDLGGDGEIDVGGTQSRAGDTLTQAAPSALSKNSSRFSNPCQERSLSGRSDVERWG